MRQPKWDRTALDETYYLSGMCAFLRQCRSWKALARYCDTWQALSMPSSVSSVAEDSNLSSLVKEIEANLRWAKRNGYSQSAKNSTASEGYSTTKTQPDATFSCFDRAQEGFQNIRHSAEGSNRPGLANQKLLFPLQPVTGNDDSKTSPGSFVVSQHGGLSQDRWKVSQLSRLQTPNHVGHHSMSQNASRSGSFVPCKKTFWLNDPLYLQWLSSREIDALHRKLGY